MGPNASKVSSLLAALGFGLAAQGAELPLSEQSFGSTGAASTNKLAIPGGHSQPVLPAGVRLHTVEEARKQGPRFFGYVQLENREIVYVLRDTDALTAKERKQLLTAEKGIEASEAGVKKEIAPASRAQGATTGHALSFELRAAARSRGKERGHSLHQEAERTVGLARAARLEDRKVALGIAPPDKLRFRVLSALPE